MVKPRPQVTGAVKPPRYRPRAAAADSAAAPQPRRMLHRGQVTGAVKPPRFRP